MTYRRVTTVCIPFLMALLTANTILSSADRGGGTPLRVAVSKFNASNKDERQKRGTSRLTVHEVRAALVHERKHLSDESQQIAEDILSSGMLPPSVELRVAGRHFADYHATYVWNIQFFFDKGPADDEGKKRLGESLTIRKRYIATQLQRRPLKTVDELLGKRSAQ